MNKVIAAFDGLNVSDSTLEYAIYLAKDFNNQITATFLEDIAYRPAGYDELTVAHGDNSGVLLKNQSTMCVQSMNTVKRELEAAHIQFRLNQNMLIAIQALLSESQFADMILIDANESFSISDSTRPSRFLKILLANTNCPLMIVPEQFRPIEKVIFAFDGSASSVYAARHFTYIFPQLPTQQVEIITVSDKRARTDTTEIAMFEALLKTKYPQLMHSIIRSSNTREALVKYLQSQVKETMVVLGAYQRSTLSRWIYSSIADTLIDKLDIPVFIAHK